MSDLGPQSRDIVVLGLTNASLPDVLFKPGFFTRPVVEAGTVGESDVVQVGTLQSYKGLEAMAVVLVGFEDLE